MKLGQMKLYRKKMSRLIYSSLIMKVAGLQTYIWSNKLKSLYMLLMFPILICVLAFGAVLITNSIGDKGSTITTVVHNETVGITDPNYVHPMTKTIISFPKFAPYILTVVGIWFVIALIFNKKIVIKLTDAVPLTRAENPRVYNIVENLCISRGLPVPQIYIINDKALNAFTSGLSPKSAIMGFTQGLLDTLDDKELEAVAAHEVAHIINYDTRLMLVSIVFVGMIGTIAEILAALIRRAKLGKSKIFKRINKINGVDGLYILFGLFILVTFIGLIAGNIIKAAISRKREFIADAGSVELTKTAGPMISALNKIAVNPRIKATESRSVAEFFVFPRTRSDDSHPSLKKRVAALNAIDQNNF